LADFIHECNNLSVPLEDFTGVWCLRCKRTECIRSLAGKSRFDIRASTWEQRLFTEVPRLDAKDPKYQEIVGTKTFVEVQGWQPEVAKPEPKFEPPPEPTASELIEPQPQRSPAMFTFDQVPDQSGRTLGTPERILKPGAKIRMGG
jgi:hypothetical protein